MNAFFYFPFWYFLLPSGLGSTETSAIILQSIYQGLIPKFIGLIFIAHAARSTAADATLAIMAIVPSTKAILGIWLLGEQLKDGWLAIFGLATGLLMMTFPKRKTQ